MSAQSDSLKSIKVDTTTSECDEVLSKIYVIAEGQSEKIVELEGKVSELIKASERWETLYWERDETVKKSQKDSKNNERAKNIGIPVAGGLGIIVGGAVVYGIMKNN